MINFLVHDIPPMLLTKVTHESQNDNEVLSEMYQLYNTTVVIIKRTVHPNILSSFTFSHVDI